MDFSVTPDKSRTQLDIFQLIIERCGAKPKEMSHHQVVVTRSALFSLVRGKYRSSNLLARCVDSSLAHLRWLNTVSLELLYSSLSLLILQYYIALLLFNFLQVTYCAAGFVDKNNDLLFRDLSQCMYACGHPLAQTLFPEGKSA